MRYWSVAAVCSSLMLMALAQSVTAQDKVKDEDATELVLTPRAIERPFLKHRLFPPEYALKDGNAATIILRMPWDQRPYMQQIYPKLDDYLNVSLDDPKLIANGTVSFDHFYEQLHRAAYRRTADWEYPLGEEPSVNILLPDVQDSRGFVVKGLSIWIRYQIATGNLDKAREGILVGLAVSRHYARTPFLVVQLVSSALNTIMFMRVEELVAHPECANMYWALTALPRPLLDIRPTVEFEERILDSTFIGHRVLDTDQFPEKLTLQGIDNLRLSRPAEDWEVLLKTVVKLYLTESQQPGLAGPDVQRKVLDNIIQHARIELPNMVEGGKERVSQMSDFEAGIRWFVAKHREFGQEITALMSLKPQQALPELLNLELRMKKFCESVGLESVYLIQNPYNIYIIAKRNDRRVDALRTVEAIRHFAARHDGRLPESLAEIDDPPVPDDPILEKPFDYKVDNGVATLTAEGIPAADRRDNGGRGVLGEIRYRIRLRE